MKYLTILISLFVFATAAKADPVSDAFVVVEQFKNAFDTADVPGVLKLFAPDAIFLGTLMQKPTKDPAQIEKYFKGITTLVPRTIVIDNYEVMQLSATLILFSGQDTFSQTKDGKVIETPGRFSFLVSKCDQGWKFIHFHSSVRPTI